MAGNIIFSDKPCSDNAEKLEITVRQPLNADIKRQQQITETFEHESRIGAIKSLHQQNKILENKIAELEQQREAELAELRKRTYRISETTIATKEHGLFQKMNAVINHYQQQINQVQDDIRQNKTKLVELQQEKNRQGQ